MAQDSLSPSQTLNSSQSPKQHFLSFMNLNIDGAGTNAMSLESAKKILQKSRSGKITGSRFNLPKSKSSQRFPFSLTTVSPDASGTRSNFHKITLKAELAQDKHKPKRPKLLSTQRKYQSPQRATSKKTLEPEKPSEFFMATYYKNNYTRCAQLDNDFDFLR